jgi:hypothetical protein
MAKTHHRRRHRRANRTRRGGGKHSAHAASAASASHAASAAPAAFAAPLASAADTGPAHIDMEAIKARVREIAAQGATHASHASKKSKGITKQQAAKKRFSGILSGKVKHSDKSAFKGAVRSDPQSARQRGF